MNAMAFGLMSALTACLRFPTQKTHTSCGDALSIVVWVSALKIIGIGTEFIEHAMSHKFLITRHQWRGERSQNISTKTGDSLYLRRRLSYFHSLIALCFIFNGFLAFFLQHQRMNIQFIVSYCSVLAYVDDGAIPSSESANLMTSSNFQFLIRI